MPSFDVVSEVNLQEVDNAVNQTQKELETRFDFRGGKSSIELDRSAKKIKIIADDDMKLRAIRQILETKLAKRSVDLRSLKFGDEESAHGQQLRVMVELQNGLSKEDAKRVIEKIKASKLKVQGQIQEDQVRVTAKKIDDLQEIIALLKASDLHLPLQFTNMRST